VILVLTNEILNIYDIMYASMIVNITPTIYLLQTILYQNNIFVF